MRDELLNETLFTSLAHAREAVAAWADDYNAERPHSALGYATPVAYATGLRLAAAQAAATVVIRETRTPAWMIVTVTVAGAASAAALVLSLWPGIV